MFWNLDDPMKIATMILAFTLFTRSPNLADAQESPAPAKKCVPPTLVTFCAMGDVPYEKADDALLPKQIDEIPQVAEFVVHVGDIKSGKTPCDEEVYIKVSGMLSKSAKPLFIIPGDNEWNDCTAPEPSWVYWEKYFSRFDRKWQHQFKTFRQLEREENFSFVQNKVLFIGLNIVGGRVHDKEEWKGRHAQDFDWVKRNLKRSSADVNSLVLFGHARPNDTHNDFFEEFNKAAEEFGKP
ncbi:MAG: hypothetical protein ACI9G1_004990, partial [Pirellulaceae bacterium]